VIFSTGVSLRYSLGHAACHHTPLDLPELMLVDLQRPDSRLER